MRRPWALLLVAVLLVLQTVAWSKPATEVLVPEGEPARLLGSHVWGVASWVNDVAFSPDGRLVATGSSDNTARLWKVDSGQLVSELKGHSLSVYSVAFSPDGRLVATGSWDKTARLWKVDSGQLVSELKGHSDSVYSVAFSPDGRLVATGSRDNTARLWKVDSGQLVSELKGHSDSVNSVAFSPDGRLVATGSWDKTARLWKVDSGQLVSELKGHSLSVSSVAFGPDGRLVATGSSDKTVRLWKVDSGQLVSELKGHSLSVSSVAFSPDGRLVVTGSSDNTARLWKVDSGQLVSELKGHSLSVSSVAFSPDGRLVATGSSDKTARLWKVDLGQLVSELKGHSDSVSSVVFSPDGRLVATGSSDSTARLWRVDSGQLVSEFKGHSLSVYSVAFSLDSRLVATGSIDNTARLWKVDSGQLVSELKGHSDFVNSVAFSPDGRLVATGSSDKTARLWKVDLGQLVSELKGHSDSVYSVAFSPDGRLVATGSSDSTARLWKVDLGQLVSELKGHSGSVNSLAFSPDGRLVATGSRDNTARLWKVDSGQLVSELKGHSSSVDSVAFSPDGQLVATGSRDNTARLWKVDSGQLVSELKGHSDFVNSVAFSPDGRLVATGSSDGRTLLWQGGHIVGQFWHTGQGWVAQIGDRLLRHDDGRVLRQRNPTTDQLEPIPPPRPTVAPQLSLEIAQDPSTDRPAMDAGPPGRLTAIIRNAAGAGRAYWLRLDALNLPAGAMLLPPPVTQRLEPGDAVRVPIEVAVLSGKMGPGATDKDQPAPAPQRLKFSLSLTHAFGDGPSVPVTLDWRAPALGIAEAKLSGGPSTATVELRVQNQGNQSPAVVTVEARFVGPNGQEFATEGRQEFGQDKLAPGQSVTLAIPVPEPLRRWQRFYLQPFRVKLLIRDGLWYTHVWQPVTGKLWPGFLFGAAALLAVALAGTVVLLRLYLDPIVRATARSAEAVRTFPLQALPRVAKALGRVHRMESTLDAARLPRERWDRALRALTTPREAAAALADAIGATLTAAVSPDVPAFMLKMPLLGLQFPADTAVLVVTDPGLESGPAARIAELIFNQRQGAMVALALDLTRRQNLHEIVATGPRVRFVILTAVALRDLLLADTPRSLLEAAIATQLPLSTLSPYQLSGGVKRETLFFGRADELRQIADTHLQNILLVGPRQMGKSSILQAVQRRVSMRSDLEVCAYDMIAGDPMSFFATKLNRPKPENEAQLFALLAGSKDRPRLWLIDEADALVRADKQTEQAVSRTMRALAEEGLAYFVLSGFWHLYAAAVEPSHPLRNFGRMLLLGPLDRPAARGLAQKPMISLQLTYESPELVEHLLDQTGCRANLLAIVCSGLIEALGPRERTFRRAHLDQVLRSAQLRAALVFWRGSVEEGSRSDSLTTADRALDRAALRAALLLDRPERSQIRDRLEGAGLDPSGEALQRSLDRLELSYLLIRDEANRYYCPIPLVAVAVNDEQPLAKGLAEDVKDYRAATKIS